MMDAEKIKSASPFFGEEDIQKILSDIEVTLRSGVLTDGPHVKNFERKFAGYLKVKHAVAVNSGTSNLEIALRYFGVKDREVIVPTNTFVATPNAVVFAGGRPVFADMRADTLCIDPADVEKKISAKTAGVIVVHVAGLVCPQTIELFKLCKDRGLFLLEDCAHAHGAMIDGRMAGTLGDAGCFSFFPTKVMTTGEGGMLVTENSGLDQAARVMRNHGQDSSRLMVALGYNWRMSEISAIIGESQLEKLEFFVRRRNEIARIYEALLGDVEGVSLFKTPSGIRHSYYKYPIRLLSSSIRELVSSVMLEKYGIETGSIYNPPCHLQPWYMKNFGTKEGDLPVSETVLKQILCLPMHVRLKDEQVRYIAKVFDEITDSLMNNESEFKAV